MTPSSDSAAAIGAVPAVNFGDTVTIFALDAAGRPFIEGRAVIVAACIAPHVYRVRFFGENTLRSRFIHPDWQHEPQRCLALLRLFWQASTSPPAFDDFFPDDLE